MDYTHLSSISKDYGYSNIIFGPEHYENVMFIIIVVTCIIICMGLPLTLITIYAVCSLVRGDHVARIYVVNLLMSDLIQFCCMIFCVTRIKDFMITPIPYIYIYTLMVSVGFMLCVALERYSLIACKLWNCCGTIKTSVVVCVVVWTFPVVSFFSIHSRSDFVTAHVIYRIILLLPLPLLIFFLCGTLKALSASRVPSDEKRRIVGTLVLVLLIYTLLFLTPIICWLFPRSDFIFEILSLVLLQLSPLADLVLYIFMRKGSIDKLLASVCCCRMDSNDTSTEHQHRSLNEQAHGIKGNPQIGIQFIQIQKVL